MSLHDRRRVTLIVAAVMIAVSAVAIAANPMTADQLSPAFLADCDARAAPLGRADPAIRESAAALTAIGVFKAEEFEGVRIGFCPLKSEGGPVGVTSCGEDIVLLDEKYQSADEALVLHATLAHEMRHVLQHRALRARLGAAYCDSAQYGADKPALERAADDFGDAAADLLARGRRIEIVNACDDPVSIYLEAIDPVAVRRAGPEFQRIPARGSAIAADRALSGKVRFFARTTPATGPAHVWRNQNSAETRFVEGRVVRLKAMRFTAPDRLDSPFRLRLRCEGWAE